MVREDQDFLMELLDLLIKLNFDGFSDGKISKKFYKKLLFILLLIKFPFSNLLIYSIPVHVCPSDRNNNIHNFEGKNHETHNFQSVKDKKRTEQEHLV